MENFRLLKADEIELRVGNVSKKGYTLLLYKDARVDMNILDETVGVENWQREHYECKGNLFCRVGININFNKPEKEPYWVWKSDCGTESNTEKEKGESSDSFKRACFCFGIGRELYSSPFVFIHCETVKKDGKGYDLPEDEKNRRFKVNEIDYVARKISKLIIADTKTGEIVFSYGAKVERQKQEFPKKLEEVEIKSEEPKLKFGKYAGLTLEEVYEKDSSYIEWLAENSNSDALRQQAQNVLEAHADDLPF